MRDTLETCREIPLKTMLCVTHWKLVEKFNKKTMLWVTHWKFVEKYN